MNDNVSGKTACALQMKGDCLAIVDKTISFQEICPLNRKLLKCLENCDKEFQVNGFS